VHRVRGGLEKKNKKIGDEDRRRTAIHEAGNTHSLYRTEIALFHAVHTIISIYDASLLQRNKALSYRSAVDTVTYTEILYVTDRCLLRVLALPVVLCDNTAAAGAIGHALVAWKLPHADAVNKVLHYDHSPHAHARIQRAVRCCLCMLAATLFAQYLRCADQSNTHVPRFSTLLVSFRVTIDCNYTELYDCLLHHVPCVQVSIVWRGNTLCYTQSHDAERNTVQRAHYLDNIAVLMAGRAAESVFCGTIDNGSYGDLKRVSVTLQLSLMLLRATAAYRSF
jgi:ATP-dependent Zn protease